MTTWILALLMFAATDPITDEALRLGALRAVFPGMPVVAVPGKSVPASNYYGIPTIRFPNALAGERVYRVTGKPRNEDERCNAQDAVEQAFYSTRRVALRLHTWPQLATDFLAIVQYEFPGGGYGACTSLPLVAHLSRRGDRLVTVEKARMETMHHSAINGIQFVDLTGDGIEDLVVESDYGGGGGHFTEMHIFDLSHGGLWKRLVVDSRTRTWHENPEEYTLTLDVARSRQHKGTSICFVKTAYLENAQKFKPPRVSNVCLPTTR